MKSEGPWMVESLMLEVYRWACQEEGYWYHRCITEGGEGGGGTTHAHIYHEEER
jgi:hypothetical protein